MPRSPQSQSLHDSIISARAGQLQGQGNRVWADVQGYVRPQEVFGHIPDVIANGTQNLISEVETAESYSSSHTEQQLQAFDSATNYRLEVVVPESVYYDATRLTQSWGISVDLWKTFKG